MTKSNIIKDEQLLKCYHIAARIVSLYGDAYLPVFKRLHKEVEMRKANDELMTVALNLASSEQ
jgi:hypothetical protein